jgi:homotetrameric cytidine deaminase
MTVRTPKSILARIAQWLGVAILTALLLWFGSRAWRPSMNSYKQQGIDVSAAQGKVEWAKVRATGAEFAYVEATMGDSERDPQFAENWQASAAAGLKRGALHRYHLCRLARDQATNFIATVPREPDELPAVIDLDLGVGCAAKPSRDVMLQEVATFIRMVEAHTEKPMIIRVSRAFETEYAISRAIDRPLWLTNFLQLRRAALDHVAGQPFARSRWLDGDHRMVCRATMSDAVARLIEAARAVAANAYAPYSGFGVGAAVLLEGGEIVVGCNFENASYGQTLCAETVALASVNALGKLSQVREIAVIGGILANGVITGTDPVRPCGRCRQVINEAAHLSGHDTLIHCASADGSIAETHTISTLLPHAFGPADLGQ